LSTLLSTTSQPPAIPEPSRPTVEAKAIQGTTGEEDEAQDGANLWKRLLISGGSEFAADAADRGSGGLRRRMFRRDVSRKVLNKACHEALPQVGREALSGDDMACRIHTDLRKTIVATRGGNEGAAATARRVVAQGAQFLPRIVTFLRRKAISEHMCDMVNRASRLAALRKWLSVTREEKKVVAVPPKSIDLLDASWEKIMSRHYQLTGETVPSSASPSKPKCLLESAAGLLGAAAVCVY